MAVTINRLLLIVLVLVCCFMSFFRLGNAPLERWDEQTNAWVVYETIEANSFPVLQYNDKPFFEKTPLWYYATIGSVKVFGHNNFALRFVSALSNVFLFILILYFAYKYFNAKVSIISGLVYLSTMHLFVSGPGDVFSTHTARSADLDLLQLLFMFMASFISVEFIKSPSYRKLALISFFCGIAFMVKGPLGLLPLIVLGLWYGKESILRKKLVFFNLKQLALITGLLVLMILPWHLLLYIKFGDIFLNEYFNYHYVNRYVNAIEGHNHELSYHLKHLLDLRFFSSGIALFAGGVYISVKTKLKDYLSFLLVIYTATVLVVITVMQTKLAWYLLYVYPLGAILAGYTYSQALIYIRQKFKN